MNKKVVISIICIVVIIIIFLFFYGKTAKKIKIGNNITSQEIVDTILNVSSYETTINVEIKSNKNKNNYIIKQTYKEPDMSIQEVIEPSNIKGIKIIKSGEQLKIENSNLDLSSIFENYKYISDNVLDLCCFIKDYKEDEKAYIQEKENEIILTTKKNQQEKTLTIDKATAKPSKMEIKWTNKTNSVYILYNEVNINNL